MRKMVTYEQVMAIRPLTFDSHCEFCGRTCGTPLKTWYGESWVWVWEDHFEEHLKPPRKVNICDSCHSKLHGLLRKHGYKETLKMLRCEVERK